MVFVTPETTHTVSKNRPSHYYTSSTSGNTCLFVLRGRIRGVYWRGAKRMPRTNKGRHETTASARYHESPFSISLSFHLFLYFFLSRFLSIFLFPGQPPSYHLQVGYGCTNATFLKLRPNISAMGRITSDVVRGMSATQFIGVGHIVMIAVIENGSPLDQVVGRNS